MKRIKLFNGDCIELLRNIPDKSIDLILADPPYGTTASNWDQIIDFEKLWIQLRRVIKKDAAILIFGTEPFSSMLRCSNVKNFKYDWIWNKTRPGNFSLAKKQPMKYHEIISVFNSKVYNPIMEPGDKIRKKGANKGYRGFNKGLERESYVGREYKDYYPSSIIKFPNPNHKSLHPNAKPVPLLEYFIKTYSKEDDLVLDFTMGSGSTGVACINTNRRFVGMEKDLEIFNIAKDRIAGFLI
ncbi:DNA-methyltransferase [Chryseobacterium indologenes]|uniref:DNA-methyltransferase n=1 Tax=Chryseobacterium indologenes TaxID=253 RepID=UPI003D33F0C8